VWSLPTGEPWIATHCPDRVEDHYARAGVDAGPGAGAVGGPAQSRGQRPGYRLQHGQFGGGEVRRATGTEHGERAPALAVDQTDGPDLMPGADGRQDGPQPMAGFATFPGDLAQQAENRAGPGQLRDLVHVVDQVLVVGGLGPHPGRDVAAVLIGDEQRPRVDGGKTGRVRMDQPGQPGGDPLA
jgi:hypothetical protein